MREVSSYAARELTLQPRRPAPSTIEVAIRMVRAWFQTPPRMADVSRAWLREHEIESAKRGGLSWRRRISPGVL